MSSLTRRLRLAALLPVLGLAALLSPGCDIGVQAIDTNPGGGGGGGNPDGGGGGGAGLPCDVDAVLKSTCQSCHGAVPSGGAVMSLVTYADLTRASYADPKASYAKRSIMRITSATSPMPPAGTTPLSAADIKTLSDWVSAGTPTGNCGGGADGGGGNDPLNAAAVCTSNTYFSGEEGATMDPGQACNNCHASRGVRTFTVAGTVFPTGHEPDNCNGAVSGATVVITDANKKVITLDVDQLGGGSGNFNWTGSLALPYSAKVVHNGKTRSMATTQRSGDCNGCHTQKGTTTVGGAVPAPGRITLPQ
jgi:cytochrome c553